MLSLLPQIYVNTNQIFLPLTIMVHSALSKMLIYFTGRACGFFFGSVHHESVCGASSFSPVVHELSCINHIIMASSQVPALVHAEPLVRWEIK